MSEDSDEHFCPAGSADPESPGFASGAATVGTPGREAAAHELESYRKSYENSREAIFLTSPDGGILAANPAACRMFGRTEEEIRRIGRSGILDTSDPRIPAALAERERTGFVHGEVRCVRSDGSAFEADVVSVLFRDADGMRRSSTSFQDLTERHAAEKALRETQAILRRLLAERTDDLGKVTAYNRFLFEASIDPLVTIDLGGSISDVNEAAVRAAGVPREQLVGSEFSDYFTDGEQARAGLALVFRDESVRNYELTLRHRDGTTIPVECNATVYRGADGTVVGVFAAARDITARKRVEARLREANRELEEFSYSLAHELRPPLRGIDGNTALIAEACGEHLDEETRRLFDRVRWNTQRMGRLIDDILAFARTGRIDFARGGVDMTTSARAAFEHVATDPTLRSRTLFTVGDLPEAQGDASLLRHAWEHLLSNALKFSSMRERPEILVEGHLEGDEAVYRVHDNGVGFDARHADKLFGVFQRLHAANEFEGTGIGLALVQRIVRRHGGRVWAQGELGRGATISFSLPASHALSSDHADSRPA